MYLMLRRCFRYYMFNGEECSSPRPADMIHDQREYNYHIGSEQRYHLCMISGDDIIPCLSLPLHLPLHLSLSLSPSLPPSLSISLSLPTQLNLKLITVVFSILNEISNFFASITLNRTNTELQVSLSKLV